MQPTLSANDFGNHLYQIERNLDALGAFSTLLDIAVCHDPGILQSSDAGLSYLIDRHLGDIRKTSQELERFQEGFDKFEALKAALLEAVGPVAEARQSPRERAEERLLSLMRTQYASNDAAQESRIAEIIRTAVLAEAGRPAWHDLDTIAARARVHRAEAARILFVLTGEDHAGDAYRASDGNPAQGLPAHLLAQAIHATLAQGDVWGRVSTETGLELDTLKAVLSSILHNLPRREVQGQIAEVAEIAQAEAEARELVAAQDEAGPEQQDLRAVLDTLQGPKLRGAIEAIADESGLNAEQIARVVAQLMDEAGEEATPAPEYAKAKAQRQKGH